MIAGAKQRRWRIMAGLVLLVGVVTHVILFSLVEVRLGFGPDFEQKAPFIGYQKRTQQRDSILLERAILFDSEPLFVPTKWNSASDLNEVARLKDETELFGLFDAVIHLEAGAIDGVNAAWSKRRKSQVRPVDRLDKVMLPPLESLGVEAEAGDSFPLRGARIEVYSMVSGSTRRVYVDEIGLDAIKTQQLWSPAIYYLVVDTELGLLPPLRTNSTGDEGLDNELMDYLGSEEFRGKIGSGYFRVEVGP